MAISDTTDNALSSGGTDVLSFLSVFATVLVIFKFALTYRQNRKLPPGPWGFPLLGHLPLLGKDPLSKFDTYRKKYGDIYRIRFGKWPTVIINGKAAIKKALYHRGDAFNDRPEFESVRLVSDMKGLSFSHFDSRYVLHRKIGASVLKLFTGLGNDAIQDIIVREVDILIDDFLSHKGQAFDPNDFTYLAMGSIIYQVVYGKGKNVREDQDYLLFIQSTETFKDFVKAGNPFDVMPWMRYILPKKYNAFVNLIETTRAVEANKIEDVMGTFDEKDIRHATDALIAATKQYSEEEKARVNLTDEQIVKTIGDFLGAGFDTTATALKWAFLFLANNPNVQEKVQKEIDDIIGYNRRPTMNDRSKLCYTEAMIIETLRMGCIAPLALPHGTCEDTELLGYEIPQNTVVFFNIFSSNYDEELWRNPYEFRPERYLNKDGMLDREKTENVLTFGIGRRRCVGEQLARMELFLCLCIVLQRCYIRKPEGEEYNLQGDVTLTYAPKPFKIQVVSRDS
ncbi:hypothetical protein FSP39_010985 [Pinctada imbricata]|uniref:unspecific monooxygenase n=1 Tax=Pinctada imbricata TaxID=66713 RepID=A0AA88YCC0_PINIB|nr:hypothetical protein FSP39_010985 [Pinctada imbricata]